MPVEGRIKQFSEMFCKRLQVDLSAQVEEFVVELAQAAEEDRNEAVAHVTAELANELSAVKADAERTREQLAEQVREETRQAAAEIAEMKAEIERLTADRQQAADDAARRAREEVERSFALEQARAALESEQAAQSKVVAALSDERHAQMQSVERVLGVIRKLDAAQSLTEILTALAEGAAAEAPRVALMTVQGDRVRSWRLMGFGPDAPPVDLERNNAAVVTRAIEAQDIAFAEPAAPGHPVPPGPGFTELPPDRSGIAVPIFVGGAPVAVLYADDVTDAEQEKPSAWPEAIEIMTRHAALRLEDLTAVRTAQALQASARPASDAPSSPRPGEDHEASARRYARLLVSEIKFYNEAAVRVGRQKSDLLERLRAEIARARAQYDERVPAGVTSAHAIFDDELVQTLADGDASLLGPPGGVLA
jgi:hypothetical protein